MKKLALIITIVMMLGLVATGCNVQGGSQNTDSAKSMVVGLFTDLETLDPSSAYEVYANMYMYATYDNLYKLKGGDINEPQPCLAESYEVDPDGLVYTFKLRSGVKFASGNPFTAEDVKFSFMRSKNLKSNTSMHLDGVKLVETPDDKTVKVTLSAKDASFLTKTTNNSFAIMDSKLVKENGGTDEVGADKTDKAKAYLDAHSAGSGPYVLKSWTKGTELVLEANPNYWGEKPAISKVKLQEIEDPNVQAQMLEKGDINIALGIGPEQAKTLKDKTGIQVLSTTTSVTSFLFMNNDEKISGPLANKDVQQAIRYALDYDGYKTLAGENAVVPMDFVPNTFIGAQMKPDNYRDLAKAKEFMKKAGYEKGFKTELVAGNFDSEGLAWKTIAEKAKADLALIGIDISIKTSEVTPLFEEYRNGKSSFLVMHWSPDYYEVNNQMAFVPGQNVGLRANWKSGSNKRLEELSILVQGEMDKAKRTEQLKEMQEIMLEDSPYAFMIQHPKSFAVSDKLDGVNFNELCKLQLNEIKFK